MWEPFLPWLIILLPLLGFVVNGALALSAARKSADAVRAGGEFDFFENGRPATHSLPTWVGPGVLLLAFLLTLVNFVGMLGAELHEPVIRTYWSWITTGELDVAAAIQLLRQRTDDAARRMFHVSLAYLFSLFLAMNVELIFA